MPKPCPCVRDERGVKTELCEACKRIKSFKTMNSPQRGTWSEDLNSPTTTSFTSRKGLDR